MNKPSQFVQPKQNYKSSEGNSNPQRKRDMKNQRAVTICQDEEPIKAGDIYIGGQPSPANGIIY